MKKKFLFFVLCLIFVLPLSAKEKTTKKEKLPEYLTSEEMTGHSTIGIGGLFDENGSPLLNYSFAFYINDAIYFNFIMKENHYYGEIGYIFPTIPTAGASTFFIPLLGVSITEKKDPYMFVGFSVQPRIMLIKHFGIFVRFDIGVAIHSKLVDTNIYTLFNIGMIL